MTAALSPHDLAEWLWATADAASRDADTLTVDIGPDHTLLVVDQRGGVVAERTIVSGP